jgi:hypothetical protein
LLSQALCAYANNEKFLNEDYPEQLKVLYHNNIYWNLRRSLFLVQLVETLTSNNISCMTIKGPILAVQAYGDLSLRCFCDLDVLIHREDFSRVYALLCSAGYLPHFTLNHDQQAWVHRSDKNFVFTRDGTTFEIHWLVVEHREQHPLPVDRFWDTPQPVDLLGRLVLTLSPLNAVWLACLHGTKHAWSQLKWVADLAQLCRTFPGLDWPALLDDARRMGFYRLVCSSLQLAEDPGGAELPPAIHTRIHADPRASALAAEARSKWPKVPVRTELPTTFGQSAFYLRSRERLRDRLYFWLDWIFTPGQADWLALPLPDQLYWVHSLTRPFRLAFTYLPAFLKSLWSRTSRSRRSRPSP